MPPDTRPFLDDAHYLQLALQQARMAAQAGEVPVGAVVVSASGKVLGQGHNRTIANHDPSAHAEILALRAAAARCANHRLEGCTLYVTLEPCAMCSGALLHARLARVVYAVADPKTGAAGSVLNLFDQHALNHQTACQAFAPKTTEDMALRDHCAAILQTFFQQRRLCQTALRQQPLHAALREDALRLPPDHFASVAPLQAIRHWSRFVLLNDPEQPASPPWRMHVLDTAPHDLTRPAILLLHGYASYSLLWQDLVTPLHTLGWRVLAPDLPGHGLSDKPKKAQRHSLAWHAALLRQWLAQVQFAQHAHRAAILHDSAICLLPELASATLSASSSPPPSFFDHVICLQPQEHAAWREACRLRPRFDLDAHWALTPAEAASGCWSAPWPDAGHRAALLWQQWAQGTNAANGTDGTDASSGVPSLTNAHTNARTNACVNTHAQVGTSAEHGHTAPCACAATTPHGTISAAARATVAGRIRTIAVPAGGAAFRRWLQEHASQLPDLLDMPPAHGGEQKP